jgi:hypothetical protein
MPPPRLALPAAREVLGCYATQNERDEKEKPQKINKTKQTLISCPTCFFIALALIAANIIL